MRLNELKFPPNTEESMQVDDVIQKFGIALPYRDKIQNLIRAGVITPDVPDTVIQKQINRAFGR